MPVMAEDWQRLAEFAAHRRAELDLTQIEVAQRGPLSLDRVQAIEGAKRSKYRLGTLLALERALEWEHGSIDAVLAGGEPTTAAIRVTEAAVPGRERGSTDLAEQLAERIRWFEEDHARRQRENDDRIRRLEDEVKRLKEQRSG